MSDIYDNLLDVAQKRRSVRRFEPGRKISKEALLRIAEIGRWAPSGANVQPWDFIIVDDPDVQSQVVDVFLRQANRLRERAMGFPAVYKSYLKNTVAIFVVLGDPRWRICFPHGSTDEFEAEYDANNDNIYFASLGAAIQNIQLGVTAEGLTSAWLSGGGEEQTNNELAEVLGYPAHLSAIGTIPIGYPAKDQSYRYRRPLEQVVHWNGYQTDQYRTDAQVQFYQDSLKPFAMYRGDADALDWDDADEKLGQWKDAFTARVTNPDQ